MDETLGFSGLDPSRLQLLRQLQTFLGVVTTESIREAGDAGEPYSSSKRDDAFYNQVRKLADSVLKKKNEWEGQQQAQARRHSSTSSAASMVETLGLVSPSSRAPPAQPAKVGQHQTPTFGVSSQPDLSVLTQTCLPKGWNVPESRGDPAPPVFGGQFVTTTPMNQASLGSQPSLRSMQSLGASSTAPFVTPTRIVSTDSVPTVSAGSAQRSPAIETSAGSISPASAPKPTALSSNFGFEAPKTAPQPPPPAPPALTTLQKSAINTAEEIERAASVFVDPNAETQQRTGPSESQNALNSAASDANDSSHGLTMLARRRRRQKRQYCHLCPKNTEGFRGPHELARHMNIQHCTKRTVYIIYDDSADGTFLKDCKHCSRRKIYGQDYNAACHLRRAHFNKRFKNENEEQREFRQMHPDYPPMEDLRPWLRKCVIDVKKMKDPKYLGSTDDAIISIERTVKHDSSDPELTSTETQNVQAPVTPPAEPVDDPEPEVETQDEHTTAQPQHVGEIHNLMEFDFSGFDLTSGMNLAEFVHTPTFPPSTGTPTSVPRNQLNDFWSGHLQALAVQPGQIMFNAIPDFLGSDMPFGLLPGGENVSMNEIPNDFDPMHMDMSDFLR